MELSRKKLRLLWLAASLLALIAALTGIIYQNIYTGIASPEVIPGTISQDIMSVITSIMAIYFLATKKDRDYKSETIIVGIMGYLFYAYGIYVIERFYNWYYFIYMAIFALAFYSIIYYVLILFTEKLPEITLPSQLKKVTLFFLILTPALFFPLWTLQLIPLIMTSDKIEHLYSIFIIDLCFIMPLFLMLAKKMAKDEIIGIILTPSLLLLGFGILSPLVLGEILKPIYFNMQINIGDMILYLSLSVIYLLLTIKTVQSFPNNTKIEPNN